MKILIKHISVFVFFCLAVSWLASCGGVQSNISTANVNSNSAVNKPQTSPSETTSSKTDFPPLASGIANADIELMDGTRTKAADKKGKILILNLWGIWCGPCREEMPHLAELQKQYGDKLEVISLNIGDHDGNPEPIPNIKKFAVDSKIDYTLGRVTNDTTREFYKITNQTVVPQTFVADRDGRLRGAFVGGGPKIMASLQDTISKLAAE